MKKVYLDNMATTPVLPEVRDAMLPFLRDSFGNPSCLHEWGDIPRDAMEPAREQVAELIGGSPEEIIFTASGTESNNFAIKGTGDGAAEERQTYRCFCHRAFFRAELGQNTGEDGF